MTSIVASRGNIHPSPLDAYPTLLYYYATLINTSSPLPLRCQETYIARNSVPVEQGVQGDSVPLPGSGVSPVHLPPSSMTWSFNLMPKQNKKEQPKTSSNKEPFKVITVNRQS